MGEREIYAAVTADIVRSRDYNATNGQPIRPLFQKALDVVNERHGDDLAVPFTITLGDECQGLIAHPSKAPIIIHQLRLQLSPIKCRVGIGVGTVLSELAQSTAQMEGQAFLLSREALDSVKRSKSAMTAYRLDDSGIERTANTIATLIDIVQSRWTAKQWEAVRLYEDTGGVTRTGAELGLTKQSVIDRLQPTWLEELGNGIVTISELLTRIG